MADQCAWYDIVCKGKQGIGEALTGAAGEALDQIADGVTSAVVDTLATLSTIWVKVESASLATNTTARIDVPQSGEFNTQVAAALGYSAWIGLALAVFSVIMLGITLVLNARRGDGTGLVTAVTMVFGGATLIGGATALVSFVIPARQANIAGTVGFIQDQTLYLTLGLAVLGTIIAGVKIGWTQRGEHARDLLRSLLTLALVSAGGVTLVNVLLELADALAGQIIGSALGGDFQRDLILLLGMDNAVTDSGGPVWLGGNVILIIVGGIAALLTNLIQIMLMVLRTGMLFLMAGILPLSAAFTNTEMGRNFFMKTIGWTLAFIFYKPAAAVIYAVAIKMSTSGVWQDGGNGLLTFAAGLMMIAASVLALPVLIGFLSPIMGAMSGSGGGGSAALMGTAAAVPAGAAMLGRGGRGFGADGPAPGVLSAGGNPRTSAAGKVPGGSGTAAAGAGASGVGAAVVIAAQAAGAARKGMTAGAASIARMGESPVADGSSATGPGPASASPAGRPAASADRGAASDAKGAQRAIRQVKQQMADSAGNEGPDGADRI